MPPRTYLISGAISIFLWTLLLLPAGEPRSLAKTPPPYSSCCSETKRLPSSSFRFRPSKSTRLIRVTSLANEGPGSLRNCTSAPGSRICVFEVGGLVQLPSPLTISEPDLLIAGQTAPSPGITLTGSGIRIATHNVEIQHLAIRPGDDPRRGAKPAERDGVSIGAIPPESAHHVTLRHLSLTWAIDENFSTWYPTTHSVYIANSIIAEGLHNSIHPKGPHSKGALIGYGSRDILLQENLLALNDERNPYIEPGATAALINNFVYGWGPRSASSACNLTNNDRSAVPITVSIVGNLFVPGPASFRTRAPVYARYIAASSRVFAKGNQAPHVPHGDTGDWGVADLSSPQVLTSRCPSPLLCVGKLRPEGLERSILANVGSRPAQRSPIDRRIIGEVRTRTGGLKDCVLGCARPAGGGLGSVRPTRRPLALPRRNLRHWLDRFSRAVERRDLKYAAGLPAGRHEPVVKTPHPLAERDLGLVAKQRAGLRDISISEVDVSRLR